MTYHDTLPTQTHGLTDQELSLLHTRLCEPFQRALTALQITGLPETILSRIYLPLAAALAKATGMQTAPLVVGINGAQGSGKTTLCSLLTVLLQSGFGLRVTTLSIDDLYQTRAERNRLGLKVHPLLATRGVPGTHDVGMGMKLLKELSAQNPGKRIIIPSFDKAIDDRSHRAAWQVVELPFDIILFEGWCVGARPQHDDDLDKPVNILEEQEDPRGLWRHHVNTQLAGDYSTLFAMLDLLIMLEVPDMNSVFAWRGLQEKKLAAQSPGVTITKLMDDAALRRFIMHYERLTRHMLTEMPDRADLVLHLDRSHQVDTVRVNSWRTIKTGKPT